MAEAFGADVKPVCYTSSNAKSHIYNRPWQLYLEQRTIHVIGYGSVGKAVRALVTHIRSKGMTPCSNCIGVCIFVVLCVTVEAFRYAPNLHTTQHNTTHIKDYALLLYTMRYTSGRRRSLPPPPPPPMKRDLHAKVRTKESSTCTACWMETSRPEIWSPP
jgi:hypothetical protein